MSFTNLSESGNFSLGGLLLVVLCVYAMIGRLVRIYAFQQGSGHPALRPRLVVQVVVLGDIGRSPRMRYHAVSLADAGCMVDLIGYVETPVGSRISTNRRIRVRRIRQPWSVPEGWPKLVYLLWAPFKAVFTAVQMLWFSGCITQYPDFIFVQNPPSIPTLAVARIVQFFRQSWLIIDWHNFGYSILGVKLGMQHPVVKFAKSYERFFGKKAYAHLTVTDRMNKELSEWKVQGKLITFKDRPQSHFSRLTMDKMHQFLTQFRLEEIVKRETFDAANFLGKIDPNSTILTEKLPNGEVIFRADRPRLIVSSTSWTEDEDFSILLKAVENYERDAKESDPKLLFVITGQGPLKSMYEEKISMMKLNKTRIVTAWLEMTDYPQLLGSADLGISLHTSSSGMDLPMKVVDMFGCGLPVCAVAFECLDELVTDGKNGLVFNNSGELSDQLTELFVTHPSKLETIRKNVLEEYANQTWQKQWARIIGDMFPQQNS